MNLFCLLIFIFIIISIMEQLLKILSRVSYDTIFRLLGAYSLFLVVFGLIANTICFSVCIRKRLLHKRTYLFIAFHCINDSLSLLTWNMDHFLTSFFYISYKNNKYSCKILEILQYASLQSSSWFLVRIF
jgi:hypothetical protein